MADMAPAAIDTLRYARRLKNAGVPADQAEVMADAIGTELAVQLATKSDLKLMKAEIKADLELMKADLERKITGLESTTNARFNKIEGSLALMRWMMGFTLAFVVALTWRAFA